MYGSEKCVSKFTDDTTRLLKYDTKVILEIIGVTKQSKEASGLKMNFDKKRLYRIELKSRITTI